MQTIANLRAITNLCVLHLSWGSMTLILWPSRLIIFSSMMHTQRVLIKGCSGFPCRISQVQFGVLISIPGSEIEGKIGLHGGVQLHAKRKLRPKQGVSQWNICSSRANLLAVISARMQTNPCLDILTPSYP